MEYEEEDPMVVGIEVEGGFDVIEVFAMNWKLVMDGDVDYVMGGMIDAGMNVLVEDVLEENPKEWWGRLK